MNREPIALYIFRFLMGAGLFIFMAMLYWSSALLEDDVKDLKQSLEQVNSELINMQGELKKASLRSNNSHNSSSLVSHDDSSFQRTQIDPSLPNLLEDDPFYTTTLPKMLGPDFKPKGTFKRAIVGKPDNLHPFTNWSEARSWIDQCSVSVARLKVGIYESFSPDMAIKVEERINKENGKPEFWVHLRDNVFWQPLRREWFTEDINLAPVFLRKHQVTAEDFKFYLDAIMNPFFQEPGAVALRTYLADIEELRVIDKLTFAVRWKSKEFKEPDGKSVFKHKYVAKQLTGSLRPLASFVYKYFQDGKKIIEDDADPDTYMKNSVWAQQFSHHWAKNIIISCGAWIFDGMSDRQVNFRRNPEHFFPLDVLGERSEVYIKESPDNIWEAFKIKQIDSYELRPDQIGELAKFLESKEYLAQKEQGLGVNRLDYVARIYIYIAWNEARPLFASKKVRQALTMAIDRQRIIRQTLNGMGIEITGTFYKYSPAYDDSIQPWPYSPSQARRLLEEEGWFDSTGSGIIDKMIDGKRIPFRFSLTYYVKNPTTKAICEYIATALKEINIEVTLNGVDNADLSAVFDGKNFDALCLGWVLGTPPDDPRQLWSSAGAKEPGSSNAIGFANKEIDAIIDALDYESNPVNRIQLYHRFDAILHDEAPYIFLYTPKTAMIYRTYLQNVFLPIDRRDLIPGANIAQPDSGIFWIKPIKTKEQK